MFKIAFIGAGSIGFTRRLLSDILAVPELRNCEIAFTDINERNMEMVRALCQRDIEVNGLKIKIHATTNRRKALEGARYIFSMVRIGGVEAFKPRVEIPLKYGVDQCIGDTLCPGGIFYGQMGIPVVLDFCRDMREVSEKDCLFMNYANPNAMLTWAANKYGKVRTLGLCHGVEGGRLKIAAALNAAPEDIDIVCAGINHQTWYIEVRYKGRLVPQDKILKGMEADPKISVEEKVRIDMFRRFGYFSTESNGHLSEYLPWYRKRPEELAKWISLDHWVFGETAGGLRVVTEGRNWFMHDYPNWMKEPPKKYEMKNRTHEHGSYIIEALETGRIYRGFFNTPNNACISNLPADAIIEGPGYVDRNGVSMALIGDLPLGCAAVCNASISVQRLSVEAAVHGDEQLLLQAMMMDPLTAAVCTPPEIAGMTDELLVALSSWLPQYKNKIAAAKKRLKKGPPVPYRGKVTDGIRCKTKTIKEMEKNAKTASRNAATADK